MPLHRLTSTIKQHPQKLFLLDGFGAILSAFLVGIVLVNVNERIGIPASTLYFLALLPLFFASYDYYSYRKSPQKIEFFLKGIAMLNLSYCFISLGALFYHLDTITSFGWIYFLSELVIVFLLALYELRTARKISQTNV